MFCQKEVFFKRFAKFLEKHLCWSSFYNKAARPATLLTKRLQHRYFPLNFAIGFYTFFAKYLHTTACAIYNYCLKCSETSSFTKLVTHIKATYNFKTLARTINTTELLLGTCHISIMKHLCEKGKLLFTIKPYHRCVTRSPTILGGLKSLRVPFQTNKKYVNNMKVALYTYFLKYLLTYTKTNLFQHM